MKIALVIERLDPSRGGRETSTTQIATALAERGHNVAVICQQGHCADERVSVRELGTRGILRVRKLGNFLKDVHQAVAGDSYDIVHSVLPVLGANVYQPRGGTIPGQIAASARRWKLAGPLRVKLFEPFNFRRRKLAGVERQLVADESVLCLPVSKLIADEFDCHYGRDRNVRVVYNAVDIPQIDPEEFADWRQRIRFKLGVTRNDPVFITVATNFPMKGVIETIRAFAKWNNSQYGRINARLLVVGRELTEGYERIAGLLDVGKKVEFIRPTREIFRYYAAADACILLSWYDPCSRTVLEATRLGMPSITTAYNGAAEILADGAGIVVSSPKDTRAVVDAMDELSDPQRRAARCEACRELADSLSMDKHVEQLLQAYQEVAGCR